MINMIKSEHLKQKHTFQKILIGLAPTFTILLAFLLMGGNYVQSGSYNWWYILILPGTIALMASFIVKNDSYKRWHGLFSIIIHKDKIWYSKVILCTIYLAITCIIFFLEISIMACFFKGTIGIKNSILATIILFITYAWQVPFVMYLSMRFKTGITIMISILCNGAMAIIFALKSFWWIPFAIPARLMCHLIGILPNGLPVADEIYSFDIKVILTGVVITVILYIIVSYLGAVSLKNKEV